MSTPIYDELEEKWNAVVADRRICDRYWRVYIAQTGAEWLEDDEGNEVFLPPTGSELNAGVGITYLVGRPDTAKGYEELSTDPEYLREASIRREGRKNRFKLFGRNQGTTGTL